MSFIQALKTVNQKYAVFSGRARRSEFWYFTLFNLLVYAVLELLILLPAAGYPNVRSILSGVRSLYSLAVLIPWLAVSWRRLHDIGRPGGSFFLILVPIFGPILLLIWFCREGRQEFNIYGPDPKSAEWQASGVSQDKNSVREESAGASRYAERQASGVSQDENSAREDPARASQYAKAKRILEAHNFNLLAMRRDGSGEEFHELGVDIFTAEQWRAEAYTGKWASYMEKTARGEPTEDPRYAEAKSILETFRFDFRNMVEYGVYQRYRALEIPDELVKQWAEEFYEGEYSLFLKKCAQGKPAANELNTVLGRSYLSRSGSLTEDRSLELFHAIIDNTRRIDPQSELTYYIRFFCDVLNVDARRNVMSSFGRYYLYDIIRRRFCTIYTEHPEQLDQLPSPLYYASLAYAMDAVPHGAEDLARAQQLCLDSHGDREVMRASGVLEEYEGFHVPSRIEARWLSAGIGPADEEIREQWIEVFPKRKRAAFLNKIALGEFADSELSDILGWSICRSEDMILELFHAILDNTQRIDPAFELHYYHSFWFSYNSLESCMKPLSRYYLFSGIQSRVDALYREYPRYQLERNITYQEHGVQKTLMPIPDLERRIRNLTLDPRGGADLARARQLWLDSRGDREVMRASGVLAEYEALRVPSRIEARWLTEGAAVPNMK